LIDQVRVFSDVAKKDNIVQELEHLTRSSMAGVTSGFVAGCYIPSPQGEGFAPSAMVTLKKKGEERCLKKLKWQDGHGLTV
jgi:hypothetical protein